MNMPLERPNWELSQSFQITQIIIGAVLVAIAFAYTVYVARKDKVLYPYFLFFGAGLSGLTEPILDVLGISTQPEIHQITAYVLFGRKIPMYLAICYFYYFPIPILWLVRRLAAGMNTRQWWRFFLGLSIFTTVFDIPGIQQGLWRYYGPMQPPGLFGFPAWWWFGQSSSICLTAMVIHLLRHTILTEARSILLIAITPILLFAGLEGPAIPITLALHSSTNPMVTAIVQPVTIALHLMIVWLCGQVVAYRHSTSTTTLDARGPGRIRNLA